MLETVFVSFIRISATTSIIILVLRLLAPYLNKTYAAKWKYWIWLILAVWLIIPAHISLPTTPVEVNIPNAPIITSDNVLPNDPSSDVVTVQPDATTIQPEQILPLTEAQRSITLLDVIALIWLIGIAAFFVYQMAGYFIFKKKVLRWSRAPQDPRIKSAIHSASSQIGLSKRVVPLICDIVSSPLMIGFFRPLLILPCETYSDADLSFIVRHELIHCRRNDLWYKLLLIIANAVHWYNPVIYLMSREANGDLELSCDDAIINGMSFAERKVYTETILASIKRQGMKKTALSTYFYGGQRTMKNRFINILNTKHKKNGALVLLAVVLAVGIGGGLVGCTTANAKPSTDATSDVEQYRTTATLGETTAEPVSNLDWVWPVEGCDTVTSAFGTRIHPITGTSEFSDHIDIAGNGVEGAAVYAALAGTVSKAGSDDEQGNYIIISHDNGVQTIYRHLGELQVSAGDSVASGDTIGTAGSTGKVSGACLAFSVYVNGKAVNPMNYLR